MTGLPGDELGSSPDWEGLKIGPYVIGPTLGRGGMGVVYRAHDADLGRAVAIKVQPSHLATDHNAKIRFKHEAQLASGLEHPNICTIHQIGETAEGDLYIVMPLYEGISLGDRIEDGALPVDEAVSIARQIADGLSKAHESGIVHRDIKPANIMLVGGRAVLLDFGIARLIEGAGVTEVGVIVGTAGYMSPEQTRGEEIDHRADLWSLGIVLYEMLTGERPFASGYGAAVAYSILNEDPKPVESRAESIPENVSVLVRDLLAKAPAERPQSAREVRERLESPTAIAAARDTVTTGALSWKVAVPMMVLLVMGLLWVFRPLGESGFEPSPDVVAAFPFSIRGSGPYADLDVATLLYHKLDGVGEITMADPNAVIGYLERNSDIVLDPETAGSVAALLGAGRFILGRIVSAGPDVVLSAALYQEGELLAESEAIFSGDLEVMPAIDDLAEGLLESILELPDGGIGLLAEATSESFEAIQHYLRAEAHLRNGDQRAAEQESRAALALDSTFAAGWYLHARVLDARGGPRESRTVLREMEEHGDRASPRMSRLIRAWIAYWESRPREAEAIYRALLSDNPKDVDALGGLTEVLHHHPGRLGDLTPEAGIRESIELFRRLGEIQPQNQERTAHLAEKIGYQARLTGDPWLVDSLAASAAGVPVPVRGQDLDWGEALANMSEGSRQWIGIHVVANGDSIAREDYLDSMRAKRAEGNPLAWSFAAVNRLFSRDGAQVIIGVAGEEESESYRERLLFADTGGQPVEAVRLSALAEPPPPSIDLAIRAMLITWPFLARATQDSLRAIERELEDWEPGNMLMPSGDAQLRFYFLGSVRWLLGDFEGLASARDSLVALAAEVATAKSLYRELDGYLLFSAGDYEAALTAFEDATTIGQSPSAALSHPVTGRPFHLWYRAQALRALGRTEEAHGFMVPVGWYSERSIGPIFFTRAQWYDEDGDVDNAIRFYALFLDQWRDAEEPYQPFLTEARERLDVLLVAGGGEPGGLPFIRQDRR